MASGNGKKLDSNGIRDALAIMFLLPRRSNTPARSYRYDPIVHEEGESVDQAARPCAGLGL